MEYKELLSEMSKVMTPPVIAGTLTWFVSQIIMIVIMIKYKPKNRMVEKAVRRGHVVKAYTVGRVDTLNRPEDGGKGRLTFLCNY
jgi:hypothetical protein